MTTLRLVDEVVTPAGVSLGWEPRYRALDWLRGVAIALMVLDHVLVVIDPDHWLRLGLTRWSLPLFALLLGLLFRPGLRRRHLHLLAAAIPATLAGGAVGIGQPDVLVVILAALLLHQLPMHPWVLTAAGWIVATNLPIGWGGYEVGDVVLLIGLGRLVALSGAWLVVEDVIATDGRLGRGLVAIGRRPLTWYVGHLVVLAVLSRFLGFGPLTL